MERFQKYGFPAMIAAGLIFLSGCAYQSHAQKKQQMVEAWDKSTVRAKLPVVRDLLDRNQIDDAQKILMECLKADPERAEVHYLIARVHLAEGRDALAVQSLRKSLELDPQQDEAWFGLGVLQQEKNDYDKAQDSFQHALDIQPAKIEYILALTHLYTVKGQPEEADRFLQEKRKLLPYEPDLIVAAADQAQQKGQTEEAIRLYKEAVLRQGNNPQLLEALGICYMGQQQWTEAADVFEKLLNLQKETRDEEPVLHWLSFCSLQAGRYGKALNFYDRLSVSRRDDPQIWLEMGQAALGADVPDRARYCGEKALQLQPSWADAEVVIACSMYMKKNYSGAVQIFQKVSQDSKWEAFGWWMAGRCYQQLGQNALARSAFEKASEINPESPMMKMFMKGEDAANPGKAKKTL